MQTELPQAKPRTKIASTFAIIVCTLAFSGCSASPRYTEVSTNSSYGAAQRPTSNVTEVFRHDPVNHIGLVVFTDTSGMRHVIECYEYSCYWAVGPNSDGVLAIHDTGTSFVANAYSLHPSGELTPAQQGDLYLDHAMARSYQAEHESRPQAGTVHWQHWTLPLTVTPQEVSATERFNKRNPQPQGDDEVYIFVNYEVSVLGDRTSFLTAQSGKAISGITVIQDQRLEQWAEAEGLRLPAFTRWNYPEEE